jgi:predicted Zn-dependent protease
MNWKAIYYDGKTARRHEVSVLLNAAGMYVTVREGQVLWWLFENLRVVQGYHPGEPVRIETTSATPEAVVVEGSGFLDAFLAFAPAQGNLASSATQRLSSSAPLILSGIATAALALFALWRWGIPAFADVVASRVPASWEESLGQSVIAQFAPPERRCTDAEGLAKLNEIITRLRGSSAHTPITLAVADLPMSNAFAAPGGYVVVFRGLLEQTENPEDLAGVLAHEIQHVEQRHATRGIVRQLSISSLLSVMTGNSSGMSSMLDAAAMLGAMKYQREDEESADRAGVQMLESARIDANGLWRMLDRMSKGGDGPEMLQYLSSHPVNSVRVRTLQQLAAQQKDTRPLLDGTDWHKVAYMCGEPLQRQDAEAGAEAEAKQ